MKLIRNERTVRIIQFENIVQKYGCEHTFCEYFEVFSEHFKLHVWLLVLALKVGRLMSEAFQKV